MRESLVNRALNAPRLSYGVSTQALAICWGPNALAVVLIGSSYGWIWSSIPIGVGMLFHGFLRWAYQKDARIFAMYGKYSIMAKRYHPHVRGNLPKPFERPFKVGRGVRY